MSAAEAFLAILAMAGVTYGTRIGGFLIMARLPMSPRLEAFLRYLSASVLVAIVVPPVVRIGPAAWLAVAATLLAVITTKKVLPSLVIGMATAAAYRALIPG